MNEGSLIMIYNGKHLIHYGQLALLDSEGSDAYPDSEGPLPWLGHKGIVVPAQNDVEIDVELHETGPPDLSGLNRLTEAIICIGGHGLLVGNITTARCRGRRATWTSPSTMKVRHLRMRRVSSSS
jgi:hypothetical protein